MLTSIFTKAMPFFCPIFRRVLSRDPFVLKWMELVHNLDDLESVKEILVSSKADYQSTSDDQYFIRSRRYVDPNDLTWADFDDAPLHVIQTHLDNIFYQSYITVEERLNYDARTRQKSLMTNFLVSELETRLPQPLKLTYLRDYHLRSGNEDHLRYARLSIAENENPEGLVNHHENGIDSDYEVENRGAIRYRRLIRGQNNRFTLTSPRRIRDA